MKFLLVLACVVVAANALSDSQLWAEYKQTHNKIYESLAEEQRRFEIFLSNKQIIEEHNARYNAGQETWYMKFTSFADMTQEEFKKFLGGPKIRPRVGREFPYQKSNLTLPSSVDWRDKGVVGPVQGQACGDCWAHSTTGVTEGQYALKTGNLIILSRQNLLDCTFTYGNGGCDGGYLYTSYNYLHDYGINSEADYPYEGVNGNCRFDASKVVTKIQGSVYYTQGDENALQDGVANAGPISVLIDASFIGLYGGGVFTDNQCDPTNLNHAVLCVGYGNQDGYDYWTVKNSWGVEFGEAGYIKMLRNAGNRCGIAADPSHPVL